MAEVRELAARVVGIVRDCDRWNKPGGSPYKSKLRNAVDEVEATLVAHVGVFLSAPQHPNWADYVATNLLAALRRTPDTGDWHGALRVWCEQTMTGDLTPNERPQITVYEVRDGALQTFAICGTREEAEALASTEPNCDVKESIVEFSVA